MESAVYPVIRLKKGREASAAYGHPWIFSGAIAGKPEGLAHGCFVHAANAEGEIIGTGSYSSSGAIALRLFDAGLAAIDRAWLVNRLHEAEARRRLLGLGPDTPTTGYRVIHGEADGVPGLVVDRYADTVVFQIATAALDAIRPDIIAALNEALAPRAIVERSDSSSRREEGLAEVNAVHAGEVTSPVEFAENGVALLADVVEGQKTGFFLDQRELRAHVRALANNRRAINLFSYTGAASLFALLGGAPSVHNVDASQPALDMALVMAGRHGIEAGRVTQERADVFQWVSQRREADYDMVIMDPPSIIKSRKDAENGKRAYHFLNRAALRLVRDGGIFATSSCSQLLPEDDFAALLRRAATQSNTRLYTLAALRQPPDHPLSPYFPEGAYLKSYVFEVRRKAGGSPSGE